MIRSSDRLENLQPDGLREYLNGLLRDERIVADILEITGEVTGREWINLITSIGQTETTTMLREECGITSTLRAIRHVSDASEASRRSEFIIDQYKSESELEQLYRNLEVERSRAEQGECVVRTMSASARSALLTIPVPSLSKRWIAAVLLTPARTKFS